MKLRDIFINMESLNLDQIHICIPNKYTVILGKPQKKVILLMAGPLRGGGGCKGPAIKEKITFFGTLKKNITI